MEKFSANAVCSRLFEDLGAFVVICAEEPDGDGQRLELQRAVAFDEQDRRNGMDTYCVCTETGACHYGGVSSWSLLGDLLTVRFNKEATKVFGTDGFEITLRSPPAAGEALRGGLRRVLVEAAESPLAS